MYDPRQGAVGKYQIKPIETDSFEEAWDIVEKEGVEPLFVFDEHDLLDLHEQISSLFELGIVYAKVAQTTNN